MAEREFIGAALLLDSPDVLSVSLDRSCFRDRNLGAIWAACQEAARRGPPGIVLTASLLFDAGVLDKVGAETFLVSLAGQALVEQPQPHLTLRTHPPLIQEWAARRAGLEQAQEQARRAMTDPVAAPLWERDEYRGTL